MTDELEQQVSEMLRNRVADLAASYEVEPTTLARARRRRATKLGALAAALVIVMAGTVAGVAKAVDRPDHHFVSAGEERPSVDTVRCPITSSQGPSGLDPASKEPRVPAAGDSEALSHMASFAAFDDPAWIVLAPKGWVCGATVSSRGNGSVAVSRPGPDADHASIVETTGALWKDVAGASLACSLSDNPAATRYLQRHQPALLPCEPDRTYTHVDAHLTTFRGPVGVLGASWINVPSSDTADDGSISSVSCRPTTGLSAGDCDTVIADWIARIRTTEKEPTTTTTVETVACPVTYSLTPDQPLPPPSTAPRTVSVGGAAGLVSYAATTDERYIALGPKGWSCSATIAADGQNGFGVGPPGSSGAELGGIGVINDSLWHGGVGSVVACSVSDDPAVGAYIRSNFPEQGPCPRAGRTLTRVDANTTTFVDPDGTRGAGWIVLPSSSKAEDGKVSVVSCQPTTGLTAAECDAIVADWIARVDVQRSTTEPMTLAAAPYAGIGGWVQTPSGIAVDGAAGAGVAAYDAATDTWRDYGPAPFSGEHYLFAARGDTVFVAGLAPDLSHTAPFASLNLTTGRWRSLAPVPSGLPSLLSTGDATHIFGVGAFESNGDSPPGTFAVEYDAAADRWSKLPTSPLGARGSFTLQWTGKELLIWSGGSNHQGCVPAFTDGAAYDPATGSWRALPVAPISARYNGASAWTGTEMLVWGGDGRNCGTKTLLATGGAYNPATNEWRTLPGAPLRPTRLPAAVWAGHSFVVLGSGADGNVAVASYTPGDDSWRTLSPPSMREGNGVYAAVVGGRPIFGVSTDGVLTAFAYPPA